MSKLASRKLFVTIITGVLVIFGEKFGVELDPIELAALAGTVVAYITGQAVVDKNEAKAKVDAGVATVVANANAIIASLNAELEDLKAE